MGNLVELKVCKFLEGTDILVSSDIEGFIKFWCVATWPHPKKNQVLYEVRDESPGELKGNDDDEKGDPRPQYAPIRAIEYNEED